MRKLLNFSLIAFVIFASALACSSNSNVTPDIVNPNTDLPFINDQSESSTANRDLLGSWSVEFNLDSLTADVQPARETDYHFNVKPYLPAPGIHVNSYDPVTEIIDVDVTIQNPTTFSVYDVRLIIFTDAIGHLLVDDDNWTTLFDIPDGHELHINPFHAYNKGEPQRRFLHHSYQTENLQIILPGGNPFVKFAIDASIGGNCDEPYWIHDFSHDELLETEGATAQVSVQIESWDYPTEHVFIKCPEVMGADAVQLFNDSGSWICEITNSEGASFGDYEAHLWAYTSITINALHELFTITVTNVNDPPECIEIVTDPPDGIINRSQTIDISIIASDPDGDNLTYEWDLDWDEDPGNFDVDATGSEILEHSWADQDFYIVGCRITDDNPDPLSTICSKFCAQEGPTNDLIRIDDNPGEPNCMDQDIAIQERPGLHPIHHVVWKEYDGSYQRIMYSNNADDPEVFGNVIEVCHSHDIAYRSLGRPQVAVSQNLIVVVYTNNGVYQTQSDYLSCRYSSDGGESFEHGASIDTNPPDDDIRKYSLFTGLDLCSGPDNYFHLLFGDYSTYIEIGPIYSVTVRYCHNYNGTDWEGFKHLSLGYSSEFSFPDIETSPDGTVHTMYRHGPEYSWTNKILYRWSNDHGANWSDEIYIVEDDDTQYGRMSVDANNNAYFIWQDPGNEIFFRKTTFGDPPVMSGIRLIYDPPTILNGCDIWASPDGRNILIPIAYEDADYSYLRYIASSNHGETFGTRFSQGFIHTPVRNPECAVSIAHDPDRMTMFNTFIYDYETYVKGKIFGEYVYFAQ